MKKTLAALTLATVAAAALPMLALAAGSNGSFELGIAPGAFTTLYAGDSTSITDWTVNSGSIDYIGGYWLAADGTRSIDLNGFTAGSMSETIPTEVGGTYTVTFGLSGNPDSRSDVHDPYYSPSNKVVAVSATGAASSNYSFDTSVGNSLGNMVWQTKTYTFVATSANTTLTFASQIPGAFGPALDNVVTTETLRPQPTNSNQCKNGGWQVLVDTLGNHFKNQGDCVSFVATNGKNLGAVK